MLSVRLIMSNVQTKKHAEIVIDFVLHEIHDIHSAQIGFYQTKCHTWLHFIIEGSTAWKIPSQWYTID